MATKSIFRNITVDKKEFEKAIHSKNKFLYNSEKINEIDKIDLTLLVKKIIKGN